MLRRFSNLLCSKCSFYSLIFAFIISLGSVNIANAYVCFLPDSSDCAKGDTEGFWPCVGSDCDGGENGQCDASYNSRMSTNECGATCTRCADASSPYNGLYKCPENTCNCNDYTSTETFNECGESCKVCRIAGDKNYGKYKCPAVPAEGCANPCNDCTLTEAQARAKMAADPCMECEQCANLNCTDAQQSKWRCSENKLCKQCRAEGYNKDKNSSEYIASQQTCSITQCEECQYNDISEGIEWYKCSECGSEYTQNYNNITNPQDKVNHCYENETCGCYMKCDNCFGYDYTMQDCQNAGYDNAKNPCPTVGKRGTVYETCCNTCNGYIYTTDLSKTSDAWSCTECPNSCDGGSKYSCVKDEQMYWCITPYEFTNTLFGGGTRDGGVHGITLEGDGVKEGDGNYCQSGSFYVPYGVSVSIKYTNDIDTESLCKHRGWIFEQKTDCCDGFEPNIGYEFGTYFTEDSFVATADVMNQDENIMSPGDPIELSPVISKADDRVIAISDRWIQRCHGSYQLVHGKWPNHPSSSLVTTGSWDITVNISNDVDLIATKKRETVDGWNSIWQPLVEYARLTGYSGNGDGLHNNVLFEGEFCAEIFDCPNRNIYECPDASYLMGITNHGYCTISDDSDCYGCYIGWHTQCVVFLYDYPGYDRGNGTTASCVDNKGNSVTKEEILTIIEDPERYPWYVTCDELGKRVIGSSLPDE